jgi:hypothetical protein
MVGKSAEMGPASMAEILPFTSADAHRRRKVTDAAGEVVIFPGIRIEYHENASVPEASKRQRRSRRRPSKPPASA